MLSTICSLVVVCSALAWEVSCSTPWPNLNDLEKFKDPSFKLKLPPPPSSAVLAKRADRNFSRKREVPEAKVKHPLDRDSYFAPRFLDGLDGEFKTPELSFPPQNIIPMDTANLCPGTPLSPERPEQLEDNVVEQKQEQESTINYFLWETLEALNQPAQEKAKRAEYQPKFDPEEFEDIKSAKDYWAKNGAVIRQLGACPIGQFYGLPAEPPSLPDRHSNVFSSAAVKPRPIPQRSETAPAAITSQPRVSFGTSSSVPSSPRQAHLPAKSALKRSATDMPSPAHPRLSVPKSPGQSSIPTTPSKLSFAESADSDQAAAPPKPEPPKPLPRNTAKSRATKKPQSIPIDQEAKLTTTTVGNKEFRHQGAERPAWLKTMETYIADPQNANLVHNPFFSDTFLATDPTNGLLVADFRDLSSVPAHRVNKYDDDSVLKFWQDIMIFDETDFAKQIRAAIALVAKSNQLGKLKISVMRKSIENLRTFTEWMQENAIGTDLIHAYNPTEIINPPEFDNLSTWFDHYYTGRSFHDVGLVDESHKKLQSSGKPLIVQLGNYKLDKNKVEHEVIIESKNGLVETYSISKTFFQDNKQSILTQFNEFAIKSAKYGWLSDRVRKLDMKTMEDRIVTPFMGTEAEIKNWTAWFAELKAKDTRQIKFVPWKFDKNGKGTFMKHDGNFINEMKAEWAKMDMKNGYIGWMEESEMKIPFEFLPKPKEEEEKKGEEGKKAAK